jgi:trk system potassium uptake protein TrkA
VLLGGVLRGDTVLRPTGGLRIEEGDVIAIFSLAADVPAVEQLLQVSIDYF